MRTGFACRRERRRALGPTPTTRQSTADATPAMRPPPPIGTTIVATSGMSSTTSSPTSRALPGARIVERMHERPARFLDVREQPVVRPAPGSRPRSTPAP